MIYFYLCDNLI